MMNRTLVALAALTALVLKSNPAEAFRAKAASETDPAKKKALEDAAARMEKQAPAPAPSAVDTTSDFIRGPDGKMIRNPNKR